MTNSNHTPGPWEHAGEFLVRPPRGDRSYVPALIARTRVHGIATRSDEECRANARLIAAAPGLLEACQEFIRKVECGEARSIKSYAQMKAAVDKALTDNSND